MEWLSAQEPGDSEDQGGPAQTDVCATQLSDEILRSCTDEVLSSGSIGSSREQQSCFHTSESPLESEKASTSSEEREEQPELSVLQKLSEKWINHIKIKEINSKRYQLDSRLPTETPGGSAEELNALQSFCTNKVNLIHQREDSGAKKSSRHKRLQLRGIAETSQEDAFSCTVPDALLNRVYLKNTRATLAHIGAIKQHVSSQCPSCNSKRAELAQSDFLKRRKTLLDSLLLQEKIDEHLHTTDLLTRVGEAHRGLPRLSDDPRIIWERLTGKIQTGSSGFGKADSK
ncbi:uncharacterized protein C8orf48 homolog isoform X2 [Cricetulus griseus]|uniref:Uncharacterized protein C8orf48 homolog isoform X2 n=1 Tax=Cricetulus griseus TaxID=10029 RepID=A0A061IJX6_CRIGR|nr:uncharacterized protein C8orf48 homolog isoform X2 [Cricetulus griseus]ERE89067.1 hypothetical protein H671_1g2605 [Cricetulus griseus]